MATTVKTYKYNGSTITDTSKGVRFTDGSVSPKNWETVWSDSYKNAKGITWTASTTYVGGSESAEKLAYLRSLPGSNLQSDVMVVLRAGFRSLLSFSRVTMNTWKRNITRRPATSSGCIFTRIPLQVRIFIMV